MANESSHRCIGKGFCGSVWVASNEACAMKREDGGPERSLRNDWDMHNIISNAFSEFRSQHPCAVLVPQPYTYMIADDTAWWSKQATKFPPGYMHCNTLISTRIPAFTRLARERITDRFCPPDLITKIKSNAADEDCLVRPYLGRHKLGQRTSRFRVFSLRNFPLHVNQMDDLDVGKLQLSIAMADAMAVILASASRCKRYRVRACADTVANRTQVLDVVS